MNHQQGQPPYLPIPPTTTTTTTNSSFRSTTAGIAATETQVNPQKKSGYVRGSGKIAGSLDGSADNIRLDSHVGNSNSNSNRHPLTVESAIALMDLYSEDENDEDFSVGALLRTL